MTAPDKQEITRWIAARVPTSKEAYGRCASVTLEMAKAFPELRRVRGVYDCPIWGERTHWWLLDPNGGVVDPTACQFPSGGIGVYRELRDGDRIPSGRCADCGETVYDGAQFCGPACAESTARYLNAMVRT